MLLSGWGWRAARRVVFPAAFLIACIASTTGRAAAVTYEPEPPFCERSVVSDPLAPVEGMPKLHRPSPSGRIGFGPDSLRLRATPNRLVGGGSVGFTLAVEQRKGLSLPWTAKATLVRVDGDGRPTAAPRRIIRKVGWLRPYYGDRFHFPVSEKPAFYRTTILLSNGGDRRLGKFSFYTWVERPVLKAKLNLNASSYRPESTVFMRVENLGNIAAFYGVDYEVERFLEGSWAEAPENPHGPMIMIGINALPGASGPCGRFWIPPTTSPGTYRISKEVSYTFPFPYSPAKRPHRTEETLTKEFQVIP
jgi:hypothetical protein